MLTQCQYPIEKAKELKELSLASYCLITHSTILYYGDSSMEGGSLMYHVIQAGFEVVQAVFGAVEAALRVIKAGFWLVGKGYRGWWNGL